MPDESDKSGGILSAMKDPLHEEYYSDGQIVLFQCEECGYTSMSLGGLHAHIEGHRGYTRFNIQLPLTKTSPGKAGQLMEKTKVLRVDDTTEIDYAEVET